MNTTPRTLLTRWLLLVLTGALALAPAAWSQTTAPANPAPADPTAAAEAEDDKVVLSPFVVTTKKDSGYFAENTLAGSRLNTNIGDLASSITVVTKQQLEDTGSVDINDVFRYEANTEGASSYTPYSVSRGILRDSIGGWSNDVDGGPQGIATANRVRGLGSADTAQNNYPTIARLAFDSYNTNSIEINRGPNSMLFGTGGASGIVNQSTAEAVLGRRATTVTLRGGSFDAWRASFSSNIPIGDNLAIYVAGLYEAKGFQRQPASDIYRRQYAALTFKPFKKTKLTANFEHYDNYNNRPNYAMPSDYVTEWIEQGRPGWNPATQMVTFANGSTKGPYLLDTRDARYISATVTPLGTGQISSTTSPLYIPSLQASARTTMLRWNNGQLIDFWADASLTGATATALPLSIYAAPLAANRTAAQWVAASAYTTSTRAVQRPLPPASTGATAYGNESDIRVITDRSIYDYTKYNIQGSNYGTQNARTYNVELQQEILPNLNFSAGWFRQEMQEVYTYGLGQANDAARLYVDTNSHLLNGEVNPYFGSIFMRDWQADSFSRPEVNNNLRAMLAYELDLAKNSGWTKNFGRHRFLALGSQQKQWNNNLRYRMSLDGGDARFLPAPANMTAAGAARNSWGGNAASVANYFYLGKGPNPVVQQGVVNPFTGIDGAGNAQLRFYDWTTQSYSSAQMSFDPNLLYAGSNFGVTNRKIDSTSFSWQAWLWNDRLIPTFGWRRDKLKISQNDRTGLTNADLYTNGFGVYGPDTIQGTPVRLAGDTKTLGGVMRPFSGWNSLERKVESGSFLAELVQNLSFHYNKSDNFNAPSTIQTDFFGERLPTPSGTGKDYGIGASLFDNKLVVRLNWFKSTNENAPSASGATPAGRTARMDTSSGRDWARQVVRIRNGQDPTGPSFDNNTVFPLTSAMQDQIATLQGLPFTWPDGRNIQTTESNVSTGKELQLTYNPTRSWTMKLTVGQQRSSYSEAVGELDAWINYRRPQWEALVAPDMAPQYIRSNGNVLRLQTYWTGTGFSGDANSNATGPSGGTGTPEMTFASIVAPEYYRLKGLENTIAPNLREWSWSFLTNYSFQEGMLKGISVGGNVRWADQAVAGYYGLEDPATYTRFSYTTAVTMVYPDLNRPIYVSAETNADVWISYTRKILSDKVRMKVQLNVRDVNKSGGLTPTVFYMDGSPTGYRIIDPRQWYVTTSFEF